MTHPSERMERDGEHRLSEAEIDLVVSVLIESADQDEYPPMRLDFYNAAQAIEQLRTDLAAANEQIDTLRTQLAEAVATWTPASEHSGLFEDGESYLVRVPVINQRYNREFMEYHIITATCDSETPVTFNDQNGDTWCAWDWEDVEAYIKLNTLSRLTPDADASGEGVG